MRSTPIFRKMIVRQDSAPGDPMKGMTWVDTSGNNTERKDWAGSQWELDVAVGPDIPDHVVEGARWSKTDTDEVKVYDGVSWVNIGVKDHANLSNLQSGHDHANLSNVQPGQHRHVEAKITQGGSYSESVSWTTAFATSPIIGVAPINNSTNGVMCKVSSKSTTGTTMQSYYDSGSSVASKKMATAMEST